MVYTREWWGTSHCIDVCEGHAAVDSPGEPPLLGDILVVPGADVGYEDAVRGTYRLLIVRLEGGVESGGIVHEDGPHRGEPGSRGFFRCPGRMSGPSESRRAVFPNARLMQARAI